MLLTSFSTRSLLHIRNVFPKSGRQGYQMILFILQNLANMFGHRVLPQTLALTDTITIPPNSCHLVLEIELEHLLRFLRGSHRLWLNRWAAAEVIDLF